MSSKDDIVGFLDDVTTTRIYGWTLVQNQETAVVITLKFNDEEIITLPAQVLRHDVANAGLHPAKNSHPRSNKFYRKKKSRNRLISQHC